MSNDPLSANGQQDNETGHRTAAPGTDAEHQRHSVTVRPFADTIPPCWAGARQLAAISIEAMDRFGHQTLRMHEQLSQWSKETAWAPMVQAQHVYLQHWLADSAHWLRALWQLDTQKTEHEAPLPSA